MIGAALSLSTVNVLLCPCCLGVSDGIPLIVSRASIIAVQSLRITIINSVDVFCNPEAILQKTGIAAFNVELSDRISLVRPSHRW